ECSTDCRLLLWLAEEPGGIDMTLSCPIGWLASKRSCYSVSRRSLSWGNAHQTCMGLASGSHLVDIKTETDLVLSSHLTTHNYLLLWTALNDRQVKSTHTQLHASD
uniref:C-type lectin domain-containing protein n=1 Tax=Esox lucius TaxID=8010 RepID=A0AAY5KWU1_ESOLU